MEGAVLGTLVRIGRVTQPGACRLLPCYRPMLIYITVLALSALVLLGQVHRLL